MEQNYKNHVQNKLNCMYGIITATPSENTESHIAYNDLSSDEDAPVSTVQNQASNANHNITKLDNDKCDILNDNIENQMNAPTQEMVNDDGELIYKYSLCYLYNVI